jgi:SAM-dependent methyltransferase
MQYDEEIWNKYTDDNKESKQQELTKFIYHITTALGAKKICEVGCNIGNNLFGFPKDFQVYGIDRNEYALEKAKVNHPSFKFEKMTINEINFPDSFFDLVFTRGVLIHIPSNELDECLKQILRVSKKWIFHLEYFGNDGEMIKWSRGDNLLWYRNMKKRWSKYNVEVISETDISENLDFGKMRFTLLRKNDTLMNDLR